MSLQNKVKQTIVKKMTEKNKIDDSIPQPTLILTKEETQWLLNHLGEREEKLKNIQFSYDVLSKIYNYHQQLMENQQ